MFCFSCTELVAGVISGALLYIKDDFVEVNQSSFLQVFEFMLAFLHDMHIANAVPCTSPTELVL